MANQPLRDKETQIAHLNKAKRFKELHDRSGMFLFPNPWDMGSAKLLESLGFEALATTSAGLAFSLARPDSEGALSREETIENARYILQATSIPVAADLENGYGDDPEACAQTILQAAKAGLAGGSIEDFTGDPHHPIYEFNIAIERIRVAARAVSGLTLPFMLTARAENLIHNRPDLKDTIRRLVAYADAGADVLYAPGLVTMDEVQQVVHAVAPKPVNVLLGLGGQQLSLTQLEDSGVKRVSVGSTLARAAYTAFYKAAKAIQTSGDFEFAKENISFADFNALFRGNKADN